ncbi:MAG: threonine-phosphate decarboxylase [Puniceicoccaceae bacterium 5H]|nr:MAG: threonine-phosphate decarboxylase [Puniceicoccaceae bacterium 5H]
MRPGHGGEIDGRHSRQVELDFSVNLNLLAPSVSDALWLSWRKELSVYPPPTAREVERRLGKCLEVEPQQLICTNGGTEALHLGLSLFRERLVNLPMPCFAEYPFLAQQLGQETQLHVLEPAQWQVPEAWLYFPFQPGSVVILANPNNPTGTLIPRELLAARIAETAQIGVTWVVDEAFIEFTQGALDNSLLRLLDEHPNLVVAGSLTKTWGIPGLRLGYLASANAAWLETLRDRQLTWPLSGLAFPWAREFLSPETHAATLSGMEHYHIWRAGFQQLLEQSRLLDPLPSSCNYFLCRVAQHLLPATQLYAALLEKGIHVRRCDNIPGMTGDYIRLAVRDLADVAAFMTALNQIEERL